MNALRNQMYSPFPFLRKRGQARLVRLKICVTSRCGRPTRLANAIALASVLAIFNPCSNCITTLDAGTGIPLMYRCTGQSPLRASRPPSLLL